MTSICKYLRGNIKTIALRMIFVTVLGLIFVVSAGREDLSVVNGMARGDYYKFDLEYWFIPVLFFAWSLLVPIVEFEGFINKRNLDTLYSMPISRKSLMTAHTISAFAQMAIPFWVVNLFWYFYRIFGNSCYRQDMVWLTIGLTFALCLVTLACAEFFFLNGNSVWDGVILVGMGVISYFAVMVILGVIIRSGISTVVKTFMSLPALLLFIATNDEISMRYYVQGEWHNESTSDWISEFTEKVSVSLILWAVLAVVMMVASYRIFTRRRAETAEGISDGWLGYKLMMPLYSVAAMLFCSILIGGEGMSAEAIGFKLVFFVIVVLGYVVYRRGFKFKKSDLIFLAVLLVASFSGLTDLAVSGVPWSVVFG